jgi:predicted dehydrogenase
MLRSVRGIAVCRCPRAFIDAIIEDRPATPHLHDGVAAQRVIDAAIRSQADGCRIKL